MPCTTVPFPFIDIYSGSRSRHACGVNTGFGDGSVHFIKNSINPVVWIGLNTIQGGEVVSSDSYRCLAITNPGASMPSLRAAATTDYSPDETRSVAARESLVLLLSQASPTWRTPLLFKTLSPT